MGGYFTPFGQGGKLETSTAKATKNDRDVGRVTHCYAGIASRHSRLSLAALAVRLFFQGWFTIEFQA